MTTVDNDTSTTTTLLSSTEENTMESSSSRSSEKESTVETKAPDMNDKGHSFRKRRLTLARHQLGAASDAVAAEESSSLSPMPRKMSRTESPQQKQQQESKALKSRVLHAGEIMRRFSSPSSTPNHRLYEGPFAPAEVEQKDNVRPAWKKRHLYKKNGALPFPIDIVGTFSCHGIEPLYDSEYEGEEDEEEDDDWVPAGEKVSNTYKTSDDKESTEEEVQHFTTAKINQDRACVVSPYGNCERTAMFGVFDGHGQGGELVSQYVVHEIPRRLQLHADFEDNIENSFKETFDAVDMGLTHEVMIEPLYAGTTACVALLRKDVLTVANTGDSRAVLGKKGTNTLGRTVWTSHDLTQDQNPDLPEEQRRIEKAGGFVSAPPEVGLSARVWLDGSHSMIGLAMARSIGDHAVKKVGVIAEPVVTTHSVSREDDLLILATDGVWEFISSQEAVDIVSDSIEAGGGSTRACQKLIEAAAAKWHEEEGSYRDDITAVVVRLQELWKDQLVQKAKEDGTLEIFSSCSRDGGVTRAQL